MIGVGHQSRGPASHIMGHYGTLSPTNLELEVLAHYECWPTHHHPAAAASLHRFTLAFARCWNDTVIRTAIPLGT